MANCDAIVFGSYREQSNVHTVMTFLETKNNVLPTECGYKFNILMFDKIAPSPEEVDTFTAILGDPKSYVERMGRHGYHGLVVKQRACKKKEIIDLFRTILLKYSLDEKLIKKVLKITVV